MVITPPPGDHESHHLISGHNEHTMYQQYMTISPTIMIVQRKILYQYNLTTVESFLLMGVHVCW